MCCITINPELKTKGNPNETTEEYRENGDI